MEPLWAVEAAIHERVHGSRGGHTTPQGEGAVGLLPAAVPCHGQAEVGNGSAGLPRECPPAPAPLVPAQGFPVTSTAAILPRKHHSSLLGTGSSSGSTRPSLHSPGPPSPPEPPVGPGRAGLPALWKSTALSGTRGLRLLLRREGDVSIVTGTFGGQQAQGTGDKACAGARTAPGTGTGPRCPRCSGRRQRWHCHGSVPARVAVSPLWQGWLWHQSSGSGRGRLRHLGRAGAGGSGAVPALPSAASPAQNRAEHGASTVVGLGLINIHSCFQV